MENLAEQMGHSPAQAMEYIKRWLNQLNWYYYFRVDDDI
jgi:hypothetical protein